MSYDGLLAILFIRVVLAHRHLESELQLRGWLRNRSLLMLNPSDPYVTGNPKE